MKYQAVIFDLDGTLTESGEGIVRSARYALEQLSVPQPSEEIMQGFMGPPLKDSFMRFCGLSEEKAVEALVHYRKRYEKIGFLENRVYPGIRQLLSSLMKAGVYLAVATGKPQDAAEKVLEYLDLRRYFNAVAGPMTHERNTDKKDLVLRVLPQDMKAVVIGDRFFDMDAVKDTGLDSIWVRYGYGNEKELSSNRPDAIANKAEDLYDLLQVSKQPMPGFMLAFEGNDGCGKTTQAAKLTERLKQNGYDLIATREPGGSPTAELIRQILLDRNNTGMTALAEAYLYAAARAQHVEEILKPSLAKGLVVLCDRYLDSSIAYQGGGRQLGIDQVRALNCWAVAGLKPDLSVYFRISPEAAMKRMQSRSRPDRIEQNDDAFRKRTDDAYEELSKQPYSVSIDATQSEEAVFAELYVLVTEKLKLLGY